MTNVAVELDFDEEFQSVSHIRIPNAETLRAIADAEAGRVEEISFAELVAQLNEID